MDQDTDGDGTPDHLDEDDDNDGIRDTADCAPLDGTRWRVSLLFQDKDQDGYGSGEKGPVCRGEKYLGYSVISTDCNDDDPGSYQMQDYAYRDDDGDGYLARHSGKVCSGKNLPPGFGVHADQVDCDDQNSNLFRTLKVYKDSDRDGFGGKKSISVCAGLLAPSGTSIESNDCDDSDPSLFKIYKGYMDSDGDGYGGRDSIVRCAGPLAPADLSQTDSDCDDKDPERYLSHSYRYYDDDLDGYAMRASGTICISRGQLSYFPESSLGEDCALGDSSLFRKAWLYIDKDGDGITAGGEWVCTGKSIPSGYRLHSNGEDCDDRRADLYRTKVLYRDADGDGAGEGKGEEQCIGSPIPEGYFAEATDLYPNDKLNNKATLHPAMTKTGPFWGPQFWAADAQGSLIQLGTHRDTVDLAPLPDEEWISEAESGTLHYLRKLTQEGHLGFVKIFPYIQQNGQLVLNKLTTTDDGRIVIGGFFQGTVDLDPSPSQDIHTVREACQYSQGCTKEGGKAAFVSVFNSSGEYLWSQVMRSNTSGGVEVSRILDIGGEIWLLGSYKGRSGLDLMEENPLHLGDYVNGSLMYGDSYSFLVQLNHSGAISMAKVFDLDIRGLEIFASSDSLVQLFASAYDIAYLDGLIVGVNPTPAYKHTLFKAKIDGTGKVVWAQNLLHSSMRQEVKATQRSSGEIYLSWDYFANGPGLCGSSFPPGSRGSVVVQLTLNDSCQVLGLASQAKVTGIVAGPGEEVFLAGRFMDRYTGQAISSLVRFSKDFEPMWMVPSNEQWKAFSLGKEVVFPSLDREGLVVSLE